MKYYKKHFLFCRDDVHIVLTSEWIFVAMGFDNMDICRDVS